jgi:hypothetical protein
MNAFEISLGNFYPLAMFVANKTIRILHIYSAASRTRFSHDINKISRHHEVAPALVLVHLQRLITTMLFPW